MLKKVFITMDTISDNTEIDTTSEFFDHKVSLPVYAAPISGILQNYGAELDDMSYTRALVDGCRRAGTLAFTGDGMHDEMFQGPMSVVKEHDGYGVPTIKLSIHLKSGLKKSCLYPYVQLQNSNDLPMYIVHYVLMVHLTLL